MFKLINAAAAWPPSFCLSVSLYSLLVSIKKKISLYSTGNGGVSSSTVRLSRILSVGRCAPINSAQLLFCYQCVIPIPPPTHSRPYSLKSTILLLHCTSTALCPSTRCFTESPLSPTHMLCVVSISELQIWVIMRCWQTETKIFLKKTLFFSFQLSYLWQNEEIPLQLYAIHPPDSK